jgi:predicted enzyme related to lactoylglutathione lyase
MAGPLVYFEVRAGDAQRARRFYERALGWRVTADPALADYASVDTGEAPGGGLFATASDDRGLLVYFAVDDIDAAIDRVNASGGEAQAKQAIPFTGWFARCFDTEGNAFSLFKSDPSVTAV